ncbi:hypothetical protein D3C87_1608440 [compost metagenome]
MRSLALFDLRRDFDFATRYFLPVGRCRSVNVRFWCEAFSFPDHLAAVGLAVVQPFQRLSLTQRHKPTISKDDSYKILTLITAKCLKQRKVLAAALNTRGITNRLSLQYRPPNLRHFPRLIGCLGFCPIPICGTLFCAW